MKRRRTSWRRSAGMTLIEVVAALALLGSFAVAMMLSRARLVEQHTRAEQKLDAVAIADALLAEWWAGDAATFPINEEGHIEGQAGWYWQTRVIKHDGLRPFQAQVVRLRILDRSSEGRPTELTAVDLVLPEGGVP